MILNGQRNNSLNPLDKHHWLNGLEMYIERYNPDNSGIFHDIKEIILRADTYKIRNAIVREIHRGYTENSEEFITTLLSPYMPEKNEITYRNAMKYIAHCIDDEYLRRISVSTIEFGKKMNLPDHFSRGQMMSKFWLIDELKKIDNKFNEVAHYGGWYATLYQLLDREFDIRRYRNFEIDKVAAGISDKFNYKEVFNNWKFKSVLSDVGNLHWKDGGLVYQVKTHTNNTVTETMQPDLIINTSCEHMDESWFHNIPNGTLVCLQTNDYFDNTQHINCVENADAAAEKYPMEQLYFKGTIDTFLYNRFMLIGRK